MLRLMGWFECFFVTPANLFTHWECWDVGASNKRVRKGLRLIWHTTIWVLWTTRNNIIFNNWNGGLEDIVEEIKVVS